MTSSTDYQFRLKDSFMGAQMLFVAFGALVLVPILTGLDSNVTLFTAGVGTLIFQLVTKGRVPVFLASSFAFIGPIIYGVQHWGIPGTLCGLAAAGLLYIVISIVIRWRGRNFITKILPPIVTGPVIMVIGLILAPVAVNMAMGKTGDGSAVLIPKNIALIISMLSLGTTVLIALLGKGMTKLIPIIIGIAVGYIASALFGVIDFESIGSAAWFSVPSFVLPRWNLEAVLFIVPVAIAPAIEHFGDILAIRSITHRDYLRNPGIHRTMLGDGLATTLASCLGGPPNTTYSEVTGAVALTKAYNPAIMTWAAIFAIALSFIGKIGAFLHTIPVPVMGGIMLLLFGAIMVVGLNNLVHAQTDLMQPRNLIIVALVLVFGIGGMTISAGNFSIKGIGLAALLGVFLNLVLPKKKQTRSKIETFTPLEDI